MLDNNAIVKVLNRGHGIVFYEVPDLGVHRTFEVNESKDIMMNEIRKLSYLPGGKYLLEHCLVLDNKEAVQEILGEVEPEYYYSESEIKTLLTAGSIEQLLDCLDYAPKGVIEDLKRTAVELEVNDITKRNAILEKTGFDVTKAIEVKKELNSDEESADGDSKTRRAAPVTSSIEATKGRRTAAPKYKVVSSEKE